MIKKISLPLLLFPLYHLAAHLLYGLEMSSNSKKCRKRYLLWEPLPLHTESTICLRQERCDVSCCVLTWSHHWTHHCNLWQGSEVWCVSSFSPSSRTWLPTAYLCPPATVQTILECRMIVLRWLMTPFKNIYWVKTKQKFFQYQTSQIKSKNNALAKVVSFPILRLFI